MDENERNAISRRQVVGSVGIGVAAAGAGPALAQEIGQRNGNSYRSELTMEDPRLKYPKPPVISALRPAAIPAWDGLRRSLTRAKGRTLRSTTLLSEEP